MRVTACADGSMRATHTPLSAARKEGAVRGVGYKPWGTCRLPGGRVLALMFLLVLRGAQQLILKILEAG